MLTSSGAKLLDFGVAKLRPSPILAAGGAPATESVAAGSSALGTLEYMAPEQLQGREVDGRTDVFAFGAVVYEMVTGVKAFRGDSALAVTVQILENDPAPIAVHGSPLLRSLDAIVRRCLEKDPDRRWQTADELAVALRALTPPVAKGAPAMRSRSRGRSVCSRSRRCWQPSSRAVPGREATRMVRPPRHCPPGHSWSATCGGSRSKSG